MDLSTLKEPLGEERFAQLDAFVANLTGQRDSARAESIEHKKGLKTKVAEMEKVQTELFERLGIDSLDDLKDLDPKGQAEARKQVETKLKRLERDLAEKDAALAKSDAAHRQLRRDAALHQALAGTDFSDEGRDLALDHIRHRLVDEDESVLYRTDDGKLIPLADGLTVLAKAKPMLLKARGAGGSGYRKPGTGEAGERNPWKKETFNLTEQIRLASENPQLAAQLKATSVA